MDLTSITHIQPAVREHSCRYTEALQCGTAMLSNIAFRPSQLSNLDFPYNRGLKSRPKNIPNKPF